MHAILLRGQWFAVKMLQSLSKTLLFFANYEFDRIYSCGDVVLCSMRMPFGSCMVAA